MIIRVSGYFSRLNKNFLSFYVGLIYCVTTKPWQKFHWFNRRLIKICGKEQSMAQVTVTRYNLMRCWKCSAVSGQVVTLACGHHFCISCLEDQHDTWTEGCKQPCQACFRLTLPKKTMIRHLTSSTNGGLAPLRGKSGHRLLTSKSK